MIRIDMEMPKTCYECPFAMHSYETLYVTQGNNSCVLTHKAITGTKRNKSCPLRELVRCMDCKHKRMVLKSGCLGCDIQCCLHPYDWYCPDGEKVTE